MKKCFDAGCNCFLPKPVKKKDVLAILGEMFMEKISDIGIISPDETKEKGSEKIYSENLSPDKKFKVRINADLKELMPDLFQEISEEIENINNALDNDDFESINRLGHGFKGATVTNGLDELSKIFLEIENGAQNHHKAKIVKAPSSVTDYIVRVAIDYVSE